MDPRSELGMHLIFPLPKDSVGYESARCEQKMRPLAVGLFTTQHPEAVRR